MKLIPVLFFYLFVFQDKLLNNLDENDSAIPRSEEEEVSLLSRYVKA